MEKKILVDKWKESVENTNSNEEKDVYRDDIGTPQCMDGDDAIGIDKWVCVVIETHVKTKKLQKTGDRIFGNYNWCSNMKYYDKGCKIMIGWNSEDISADVIHVAKLSMLCKVEYMNVKIKV
ncbi:hypothetical protein Tco_1002466 [Tanacetum coccineum]|uniref:Uncharacterized protein n=1 Tax=Tanacetum coccineum TaxID=301880 RepID=A0ABQ5F6D5_9ASTR